MFKVSKRYILAVAAAAGLGLASSSAMAADPSVAQLQEQIKALQAQVQDLRDRPAAQTYNQQDVDSIVKNVLKDANRHSVLLDPTTGWTAGYDMNRGFVVRSEDGAFSLHPWLQVQIRDNTNYREHAAADGSSITENGIELRRAKFGFDGNLFGHDLTYMFYWGTTRGASTNNGVVTPGGVPVLEEGWIQYMFHNTPFGVRAGQIHDPVLHEQMLSSKYLTTVERSLQADLFLHGDAYIQAIEGLYKSDMIHGYLAFTDGLGSNNTNFQDFPDNNSPADYGAAGRIEVKLAGDWSDYDREMSSVNMKSKSLLVVGIGADYTEAGHNASLVHTADVQWNSGPLAVYGAYVGRYMRAGTFTGHSTYDSSILGQVSYLMGNWEPFAQYDYIHFDSGNLVGGGKNNVHQITAGVNYYWHGHNAKFTADVSYLPNGCPVSDDSAGILASSHNEVVLRVQFQLLI